MEAVHLEDLSIQRMFLGTLIVTQEYSWMLILIITGTEYSVNSFFITDEGKWCCQLFRMETFKISQQCWNWIALVDVIIFHILSVLIDLPLTVLFRAATYQYLLKCNWEDPNNIEKIWKCILCNSWLSNFCLNQWKGSTSKGCFFVHGKLVSNVLYKFLLSDMV